ncbi:MAG: endonuclease/exonuclease/phosphatase family protein [Acidobacteriota bacterium]
MQLRFLTYNIHKGIGIDRRFRLDRTAEVISHYAPDVVLLQEVDQGAPRSRSLDLAVELSGLLKLPGVALGLNVDLKQGKYGNAILSRFPIVAERNIDLTMADSWIRRGCQHATLDLGRGWRFEVFNLHLGLSARERVQQVAELVRSDEYRQAHPRHATVIGGDFNDWRSLLLPTFTESLGFRCATERAHGRRRVIPTYPSFSPQGGLDRLYYRGPVSLLAVQASRLRLARLASDHLPVIADFVLDKVAEVS